MGRHRESTAWRFFDRVVRDEIPVAVICKLCEKQYKFYGNTSNLRAHLLRAHPIQWELANNGTLDEETLKKTAFESKTDIEQSDTDVDHNGDADQTEAEEEDGVGQIHLMEHFTDRHSNEEWLEEDRAPLNPLKSAKKAKKRKLRVKNFKRELITPPPQRNILTYDPDSYTERPSVPSPVKDEYSVFGEYIANKLRKFKLPRTRGNIQQLITTILWQAEYGMYDSVDSVKRILISSAQIEPQQQAPEHVINVTIDPSQLVSQEETIVEENNE